jgi:hypothetical protein
MDIIEFHLWLGWRPVQQLRAAERGLSGPYWRGPVPVSERLRGARLCALYAAAAPVRSPPGSLHRPAGGSLRGRYHDWWGESVEFQVFLSGP